MPIHVLAAVGIASAVASVGGMVYSEYKQGQRMKEAKQMLQEQKNDPQQMAMLQQMYANSQQTSQMLLGQYGMRPGGQFAMPGSYGPAPQGYYPQFAQYGSPMPPGYGWC